MWFCEYSLLLDARKSYIITNNCSYEDQGKGLIYMEIFKQKKHAITCKNLNLGWNAIASSKNKIYESKKDKPEARQKQIEAKMVAVNKKLQCIILQQVNVISLLLLQMVAIIESYQYSRMRILHMNCQTLLNIS